MDSVFGIEISGAVRFVIAFVIVLALIAITAWLVRRFGSGGLGGAGGRGRQPRLAVIDAATVDARRKLILVRRDNVEHLVMIGGPTDVVIEPNIVRGATPPREVAPPRTAPMQEPIPRPVPLEATTMWPLQPEPAPRPQRPVPPVAAQWSAAGLAATEAAGRTPHPDAVGELSDAVAAHAPPLPEVEPEPPAPKAATHATAATDQHLAEMAQRLEAVLRRPAGGEPRLDIPVNEPPVGAPTIAPLPDSEALEPEHAAPARARPPDAPPRSVEPKKFYETIEEEMASLLGRPTGKT
jgi:hypothetical protein